ncbi:ankyrin repeat and sterile alpha motif domain-containing protein 1B-like isoform X2 [Rhynchophorus ferrugineus]|uniref:ankyrin repeat and sterile alpha motif domain-containing protein 1B-like isoform X2 n=1 Tax=Rhynchophorus ferrugineus TaxID=354439 RepID=UPI003FCE7788
MNSFLLKMGKDQELLEAARKGNTAVVEKILGQRAKRSGPLASLRRGPGANVQDSSGYTSLHHAALNGHIEIVRLLLEHDASPNIVDSKGSSPLHLAAWSGNLEIVKLLLSGPTNCNVNLTTKDDETALHCAAQYGHTAVVSVLLEHACDPGIRNSKGETALELAAQYGRLETVELLVRTDPTLIQCWNRTAPDTIFPHTALHLASRNGHKAVVDILLRAGFKVNMRTKAGTALHEAALCGKVEVVRTLLENGVDTSIRDSNHFTVMDLLNQFNNAQAAQEIINLLKRHKRGLPLVDSDGESISNPFPIVPNVDSDLGSPYENVRPCLKSARSITTDPSPGTSPQRWDYHQRIARPPEGFEDRRVSGVSEQSILNNSTLGRNSPRDFNYNHSNLYLDMSGGRKDSDNSLYQIPSAPKQFMDTSIHSEDPNYLSLSNLESDQISLSSTSSLSYGRRTDNGTPLYTPMSKGAHSPSSGSKVSPTPPKKPPRRTIQTSPTHCQAMSVSVDGVSNSAYEYIYFAHTGTKSQNNLNEVESDGRRDRLSHGHSVDQYVEMNIFASEFALDDEPIERPKSELQRGKSEDLDNRKKLEPVAITSLYENMPVKQQNPRRKLRRHNDMYEDYQFKRKDFQDVSSSSAPENTFISTAYLKISDHGDYSTKSPARNEKNNKNSNYPLSPTHYNQPPTPEHPPPSAMQAESVIYDKIRPLSQEYKRRSKDMETETEEEYLLIGDHESSGSFSSSVSLSDRSVDNILEEYHSDTPYSGLIKGSATGVLESLNMNIPAVRPKTLKKLKRVYDNSASDDLNSDNEISSSSEKESDNKENRDGKGERVSALSPFDEQEEWAKIQEIMASFGTGIVRESVFVAELEKEFQNRLMTISCSQNSLNNADSTVEKWLQRLGMADYAGLFMSNGFDDIGFLNGVLEESDLIEMGITAKEERDIILEAVKQLPIKVHDQIPNNCNNNDRNVVRTWLKKIHLEHYFDTFNKHLYHDMERIKRIWDVELSAVLDIEKCGHRKRILASVSNGDGIVTGPKLEEISSETSLLKSSSHLNPNIPSPSTQSTTSTGSSNTGTIRHRHKKSRPAPQPPVPKPKPEKKSSEIFVGGTNSIKSQWRHQPILLITGSVKYSANYWGSTTIKDFKGTDSTKKSIEKILKSKGHYLEEITLSISYKGVKFINPSDKNIICEHEIVNMNCACQDDDEQSYFAYITKDNDLHYCHVFQALNSDYATEIILTLGQAFELAYQMALRDHVTSKCKNKTDQNRGDKSAVSPGSVSSHSRDFKDSTRTTDIKLNGHPLKIMPLTLSIAGEPSTSSGTVTQGTQNKTPTKAVSTEFSA